MTTTTTIHSLCNDEIVHILTFVTHSDLLHVSHACRDWSLICMSDMFWQPVYDAYCSERMIDTAREKQGCMHKCETIKRMLLLPHSNPQLTYRDRYLALRREVNNLPKLAKKTRHMYLILNRVKTLSLLIWIIPLIVGILIYSILPVLLLDQVIEQSGLHAALACFPIAVLFIIPYIITIALLLAINLVFRWTHNSRQILEKHRWCDSVLSDYEYLIYDTKFSLHVISGFGFLPVLSVMLCIRFWFDLRTVPYRTLFIPNYVYTATCIGYYIMTTFKHWISSWFTWSLGSSSSSEYMTNRSQEVGVQSPQNSDTVDNHKKFHARVTLMLRTSAIVSIIILIIASVQLGLIGLKLDKESSYWVVILLPLLIPLSLVLLGSIVRIPCSGSRNETFAYIIALNSSPLLVWLLLFAIRLDGIIKLLYVYTWIPLYMSYTLFITCIASYVTFLWLRQRT